MAFVILSGFSADFIIRLPSFLVNEYYQENLAQKIFGLVLTKS